MERLERFLVYFRRPGSSHRNCLCFASRGSSLLRGVLGRHRCYKTRGETLPARIWFRQGSFGRITGGMVSAASEMPAHEPPT